MPAASVYGARLHVGGRLPGPLIVPLIFVRNAFLGWFFATPKNELIDCRPWPTPAKAREATIAWIEGRYNRHRRHSALGMKTPLEFEHTARHAAAQAA